MVRLALLGIAIAATVTMAVGQNFSEAIEDNSFLIEEAYNQEYRVVQHISTGYYRRDTKQFLYTFTQEWPLGGQAHQLSFTIPYLSMNSGIHGLGDIFINYRYQLWDDKHWAWVAPRISLILPTGSTVNGLGNGVPGAQACIPLSKRWSDGFIAHFNIGGTIYPNAKGTTAAGSSIRRTLPSYFLGGSGIWLLTSDFNFLCEVLHSVDSGIDGSGKAAYSHTIIISPGMRFAVNLGSLQIVPGVAFPVTFASGTGTMNIYGYLSFEHPY